MLWAWTPIAEQWRTSSICSGQHSSAGVKNVVKTRQLLITEDVTDPHILFTFWLP